MVNSVPLNGDHPFNIPEPFHGLVDIRACRNAYGYARDQAVIILQFGTIFLHSLGSGSLPVSGSYMIRRVSGLNISSSNNLVLTAPLKRV